MKIYKQFKRHGNYVEIMRKSSSIWLRDSYDGRLYDDNGTEWELVYYKQTKSDIERGIHRFRGYRRCY